ncbi:MAG TPA: GNAT family N-acetyltransferase, partial [Trebonia sp.]
LVALHGRFSERTRYLRFFGAYPRIPSRDLRRFANVDHRDREAFVALADGDIIAVGRYERLAPGGPAAEVAFVVEDAHQGRGIAPVLLDHLMSVARDVGIERFVADVLPGNSAMLQVFAAAGHPVESRLAEGVIHLEFPIDGGPAETGAPNAP